MRIGNRNELAGTTYIRADGTVGQGISLLQTIAHESAHALLRAVDTTGSGSSIDYHGDAVRFENQVLAELGSGLIDHIQKMTMAAIAMADMKVWAQRS